MKDTEKKSFYIIKKTYDILIVILAIVSITLVFLDLLNKIDTSANPYFFIDTSILIIFTIDYFVRFFCSKNKFLFFRKNIFDLLAIIPFSTIFSFFRFSRIFRISKLSYIFKFAKLVRLFGMLGKIKNKINFFLHTNGFIYMLYISFSLIFLSSVLMSFIEKQTFFNALWWSIVTCTTVGYGDISPTTPLGRFIAIILMVFGIGFISMLTGTITTYFSRKISKPAENSNETDLSEITKDMTENQIKQLTAIAVIIKNGK